MTKDLTLRKTSVPTILSKLEKELENLKHISETNYRTSGIVDNTDIKTLTKESDLIAIFGGIITREKVYNEAAKELGRTTYPIFQIGGCNTLDWKHDIDLRIQIITHEERKSNLEKAYDKMKRFLSEEDQKAIAMKEIAELLKS